MSEGIRTRSKDNRRSNSTSQKTGNVRQVHFKSSLSSDLTFLFPDNDGSKLMVEKHRLMDKSDVFRAQFATSLKDSHVHLITINDISFNTFLLMINHLYDQKVAINEENCLEMLYASRKYCINTLTYDIIKFLVGFIKKENLAEHFEAIDKFGLKMLNEHMVNICTTSPLMIIERLTISSPHKRILEIILQSSCLPCSEFDLYRTILRMLKREFRRLRKPIIEEEFRKELGSMVYLIRFPSMTSKELIACGMKPSLLSGQELIDIQLWVEGQVFTNTLQHFSASPRFAKAIPHTNRNASLSSSNASTCAIENAPSTTQRNASNSNVCTCGMCITPPTP
ncbi:uncharacterized protein LOC129786940 [Lutzomyia longipalpis]|uniref:Putative topoisomerase top1-interacting protein btbd1 n=1 Tax=Lutzomyia longipalpis TaxID=7200 RepID=A0A1B0CTN2_LUTLO|nr:uncharacterized protein LOC129786940 [Lutzomyia longipalpis]